MMAHAYSANYLGNGDRNHLAQESETSVDDTARLERKKTGKEGGIYCFSKRP